MELTHIHKSKISLTELQTRLRTLVTKAIRQQAVTFEALTHGGTPFGGNWLPDRYTQLSPSTEIARMPVLSVQQQVNELTQQVAQLTDQVNALRLSAQLPAKTPTVTAGREIGLNRFRALQDQ